MNSRRYPILILLILLGFALRLHNLGGHSLWYDELLQLDLAQGSLVDLKPQLERHAGMPLDYVLTYGWIKLGRQETWVRIPALFFGTLAIPLIYALGCRLFNRRTGFVAALLLAVSSFAVRYSQEVRPYALLMTLTLIGFLGLWLAYRNRRNDARRDDAIKHPLRVIASHNVVSSTRPVFNYRFWGVAIFGFAGAVLSHYFALFLLVPVGLYVATQQVSHVKEIAYWRHTAYFGLLVGVVLALCLIFSRANMLYWVGKRFATDLSQPTTLVRPSEEKPNRGTGPTVDATYIRNKILQPLASSEDRWLIIYTVAFTIAVATLVRHHSSDRSGVLLLLAWLIVPASLIYLFLLARGTFFASRYILYTLPAFLLLVSRGIDVITAWVSRKTQILTQFSRGTSRLAESANQAALPSIALGVILPALFLLPLVRSEQAELNSLYTAASYEDWRSVGQLLEDNAWPNDAVVAVRAEPAINWYFPAAHEPFGHFGNNDVVWAAINENTRHWFVLSSYSRKRDAGLRQWLNEQGAVAIAIDRRVVVYFHQEGLSATEHLEYVRTGMVLPPSDLMYAKLAEQSDAIRKAFNE